MSTRCNIHFTGPGVDANIYRHYDGYPDGESGVLADIARFYDAVEAQTSDTRYGDAAYLAAKFVVWQAGANAREEGRPLAFTGVGVESSDAGDGEYIYTVHCKGSGRPEVTWQHA